MSDTQRIIRSVLDEWSNTQLNIAAESGREMLSEAIGTRVDAHISQLIEDIVCSQMPRGDNPGVNSSDTDHQIYNQTN